MIEPILILIARLLEKCPIDTNAYKEYEGLCALFSPKEKTSTNFVLGIDNENPYQTKRARIDIMHVKETAIGIIVHGEKGGSLSAHLNGKSFSAVILYFKDKKSFEEIFTGEESREKVITIEKSILLHLWRPGNPHQLDIGPAKDDFLKAIA